MGHLEDLSVVLVSALALGVSSRIVTTGIDKLWEAQLLFYKLAEFGGIPFTGNRDIPVLFIVGILSGWFLLFLLDGTKRIQAAIVFIVGSVSVGPLLSETGRILEAINRSPNAFIIGILIGLVTGGLTASFYGVKRGESMSILQKLSWIQFTSAVGAFRSSIAVVVLITAVDYWRISEAINSLGFLGVSFVLIISLSVFMKYDYRQEVVAISPPDDDGKYKYLPYVLGGLFHRARKEYHGFSIYGRHLIAQASRAQDFDGLLEEFKQRVGFGFVSGVQANWTDGIRAIGANLLPRTVRIISSQSTTDDIAKIESNRNKNEYLLMAKLAFDRIGMHIVTLIPSVIRRRMTTNHSEKIALNQADKILLIGPTLADDEVPPEGVEVFDKICARYNPDPTTDVIVATTEAQTDPRSKQEIQIHARENLGIEEDHLSWTNIYPLPWYRGGIDENNNNIQHDDEYIALLERLAES